MTDILFETVRAIITGIIFSYLSIQGWKQNLRLQRGWLLIQLGFGLLLMGSLIDITDNFPELNRFIIIGQTGYEAFLEKIVGYTMGFLLLAVGFWKWLPTVVALSAAQNALRESEARFRSVYNNIGIGIALIGKDMKILSINPKMQKWFPHIDSSQQHICYRSFNTPPRDSVCSYCPTMLTLQDGQVHSAVTETPTGIGIRNYQVISSPLLAEDGTIIASIEMVEDITEQMKAQKELEQFNTFFRTATDLMCIADPNGAFLRTNPACSLVLGYSEAELISKPFLEFIHPEDKQATLDEMARQRQKGFSLDFENRYLCKNGSVRWLSWKATYKKDEGITYAVARDITEQKKAEHDLREVNDLFFLFMKYSPVYTFIKEVTAAESRVLQASENFKHMIGIPGSEMIGKSMQELFPPEFAAKITADDWAVISGGNVLKLDEELYGRAFTTIKFPIVRGEKTLLAGYTIDITDRKLAEQQVRQSEEFIRGILNTVDEGFIVIDPDYRIVTANKAYCSQVGGCDEKIIGRHCYEISHKIKRPCYEVGEECAVRQTFETGLPHSALHRHKDDSDNILYVETKAFPIKDDAGKITSVIETINNITEKYLLEEERLKTQKLESIGTLAGGIAHDFNNLLQGVFGYISMAKMTHDRKEKSLAMLDQAEEALHLSVNLTTQLLTFSKGGKPVKKLIKLEPVIENAVKFALSGSHTDYRIDTAPGLRSVEADAGQLAQVIQNIVLNANEAMAGRGTVTIAVRNMDIHPKANPRLPGGGQFVRIDIRDTGIGISEQNIPKIFDPYFTTKQRGSGLGLATTYSIIRNHGGLIEVDSAVNRGTTFTIYLPASMAAEAEIAEITPSAVSAKNLKVLLMDDEDLVRNVAKEMVAAFGHEVEGAEDGKKAIKLFQQAREAGRPFDLVILDLTVKGGMGGEEAIAKIREIDPNVKAVVSSGYSDSPIVADYRSYGFSAVLNKPYKLASLKDCLNQISS